MVAAITGLPGSGKSTFAKALASRINGRHISSDAMRFKLALYGQYDENAKLAVYDLMLKDMEDALMAGDNVVLDATFYKNSIRERFKETARKFKTPFFLIKIEAAEAVIKERISKRREDSEADFQIYQLIKSEYEPITDNYITLKSDQASLDMLVGQAIDFIEYSDGTL
ncbi:AAA family ATPase [Pedobacter sp.]|uniref:AAA family ATPase n=1 Tax=Pedobacter sp. TaxID=1411316 RepID=UPI003D7FE7A9